MIISRERLSEVSRTFLEVLDREKVANVQDLERLAGQTIPIGGKDHDYLTINWRPSNRGSRALSIEYIIQHRLGLVEGGIPLNVRINPTLAYTQIILKCWLEVGSYETFAKDAFGNAMQSKILMTPDWKLINAELVSLSSSVRS